MDLFKDIRDASNEIGESIHDATDAIKKKLKRCQNRNGESTFICFKA